VTVTPTTFAALQKKQQSLIRKGLEGAICFAPITADLPLTLTTGSGSQLATLPTGYEDIGMLDQGDGATWSRKIDTSTVNSWGFSDPTRVDIKSAVHGLKFTAQETKMQTLGMYHGADLSAVTADATTGEISLAAPARPANLYYRCFALAVDGVGADEIYLGKILPKCNVTDTDDIKETDGDDNPISYGITMNAEYDSVAGYSIKYLFGGPGWKALLTEMGFASGS
jgi:hypothetical protein